MNLPSSAKFDSASDAEGGSNFRDTPNAEDDIVSDDNDVGDNPMRYALLESLKSREGIEKFVQDISTQMLLEKDCSWGEMISAAPRALCAVGQCFIASTAVSDLALLKLPTRGELGETSLRAALMSCSGLGRLAFEEAHRKMNRVATISGGICGPHGVVERILEDLDNDHLVKHDLQSQLDFLKDHSKECTTIAKEVNARFESWRDYASKLRVACASAGGEMARESRQLQAKIESSQWSEQVQEDDLKQRREHIHGLREDIEADRAILKKSIETVPSGFNFFFVNAWGTICDTTVQWARSFTRFRTLDQLVRQFDAQRPAEEPHSPIIENPDNDFGFHIAKTLKHHFFNLVSCLRQGNPNSPDFSVDFNRLLGFSSRAEPGRKVGSAVIEAVLSELNGLKSDATNEQQHNPLSRQGKQAIKLLDDALHLCNEIHGVCDSIMNMTDNGPNEGQIRLWQTEADRILREDSELCSERDFLADRREKKLTQSRKTRKDPSKLSKNWAFVQTLQDQVERSQKRLDDSQEEIRAEVQRQRELTSKFHDTQLKLMQLNDQDFSVRQVIDVLEECISNLTDFQAHVQKLVFFFHGIQSFVDDVERKHVNGFLTTIDNIYEMQSDSVISAADLKKSKDHMKHRITVDALTLQGHYTVAKELASVYVFVSKKHILPGVHVVERLGITHGANSGNDTTSKTKQLADYALKAQHDINNIAEQRRTRLRDILVDDKRAIEEVEQYLLQDGGDDTNEWGEVQGE